MKQIKILLNTIDKVKRYTDIVSKEPSSMDISSGDYTIDGKSILGIFSLNLFKPLTLKIYEDEEKAENIIEKIQEFVA